MSFHAYAALSRRTLRQEQLLSLQNALFRAPVDAPIALAVMLNHVDTAKVIEFRKRLAPLPGSQFRFTPLSVVRRVVANTKFAPLQPLLAGKVTLLISPQPVLAAKLALEFAKKYPQQFVLLGGCYEGNPLNQSMIQSISELPEDKTERNVKQFGQLVSLIRNPTFHLYRSLQSHANKWVGGMLRVKQHIEEKEKAAAPAAPAAEAPKL